MRVLLVCLLLAAAPAAAQLENITDPPGNEAPEDGQREGDADPQGREDAEREDRDGPSGLLAFVLVLAIVAILVAIVVARRRR